MVIFRFAFSQQVKACALQCSGLHFALQKSFISILDHPGVIMLTKMLLMIIGAIMMHRAQQMARQQ